MQNHRSIKQKLYRTVLLIGVLTSVASLLVSVIVMVPSFWKREVQDVTNSGKEMIQQIDSTISFVQDYTESLSLSVAQNVNIMDYFLKPSEQSREIAALYLNQLISSEGVIRCVVIEEVGGNRLDSLTKITAMDKSVLDSPWYDTIQNSAFGSSISPVYESKIENKSITSAAYSKVFYISNRRYIYTAYMDLTRLLYESEVIGSSTFDYFGIVDVEQNVFFSNGDSSLQQYASSLIQTGKTGKVLNGSGGIGLYQKSFNNKWAVVAAVSYKTILHGFAKYILAVFFVLISFLVLVLIFISRTMGAILKPIAQLSKSMEAVAEGNLECRVEIVSEDEIGRLSKSFNRMVSDLKKSLKIISKKEEEQQRIKFSLLISQIDPHFIYNTINSINYLARQDRSEDVITVNSALMAVLRDRLRVNDIEILDTVAKEIKVLEQYIVIQRYRYDGNLELEWNVNEELLEELIPKNMIQPLIENALFHGLIDEETGNVEGKIWITLNKDEDDKILIQVEDNGMGMSPERLLQVRKAQYSMDERGRGIGLSNIRERLFYLYNTNDGLKIESVPGKGTRITLSLPKRKLINKVTEME
ncbi:MAG: sensor histidine kinase [Lachnospiraceae bacterium]